MLTEKKPDIGIAQKDMTAVVQGLSTLLADTYTLYVTTQGYHWNVTGPMFHSLHAMFEEEYIQLREAADVIAERIRALGDRAPGSFAEFEKLASIGAIGGAKDSISMVENLALGHEAIAKSARPLVETAEEAGDVATADLITQRIQEHEKTAWMLRATAA